MSQNINQIYMANPATSMQSTDLLYFGRSPYDTTDDFAITFSDFAASITTGTVTSTQVQQSAFNVGIDSGIADAYIVTLSPVVTVLTDALLVGFTALNDNVTTTPTLTINALAPVTITRADGSPVLAGDISATTITYCIYSATANQFIILNPAESGAGGVLSSQVQQSAFNVGIDSGVADAYVVTLSPVPGSYTDGLLVAFTPTNTNLTRLPTLQINGLSAVAIIPFNYQDELFPGDININEVCYCIYSAAVNSFYVINPAFYAGYSAINNTFSLGTVGGAAGVYTFTSNLLPQWGVTVPFNTTNGATIIFTAIETNTGACTLEVNGNGTPNAIVLPDGSPLSGGELATGNGYLLLFSSGAWEILNPSPSTIISSVVLSGSAISLTTATAADITSIQVPAGTWRITGNGYMVGGANVLSQGLTWGSLTSATAPDAAYYTAFNTDPTPIFAEWGSNIPSFTITVGSLTTVYLSIAAKFATSTCDAFGAIYAERIIN